MASPKPPSKSEPPVPRYFFILGRETKLSAAEIGSVLGGQIDPSQPPACHGSALVLAAKLSPSPDRLLHRLGGTVKLGRIILDTTFSQLKTTLAKAIFESGLLTLSEKVVFGISVYGETKALDSRAVVRQGMELKKELQTAGYAGRFVNHDESTLSSVSVTKNNLIEDGGEIVLIVHGRSVMIGRTEAVQDFESYSQRDYGRPGRDMLQGMLPPKLAQIMINLVQAKSGETLLDPFCGSGTVLQEAYLLGLDKLIGFDANPKAIRATEKNINWLRQLSPRPSADPRLETHDATRLAEHVKPNTIDVIVTEPYLGPTRQSHDRAVLEKLRVELTGLYTRALEQFAKVLKPSGRVAMIVPCWFQDQIVVHLPLHDPMRRLGFALMAFPDWAGQNPFLYHRPGQRVGREIYIMELNK